MRLRSRFLSIAVACSIPALGRAQSEAEAHRGYDSLIMAMTKAMLKGDAAAIGGLLTADYSFLAPGLLANGRAATIEGMRQEFHAETFDSVAYRTTVFRGQGPLAYAAGILHTVAHTSKDAGISDDHFLAIIVRETDGQWRFRYVAQVPSKLDRPK